MDLSKLRARCRRYVGSSGAYIVEPIPDKMLRNARSSLAIPPSVQIVALIDLTSDGSASDAIVITNGGLHWRDIPSGISWQELRHRKLSEDVTSSTKIIRFGYGLALDLSRSKTLAHKRNHTVLYLLNDLIGMVEPPSESEVGDAGVQELQRAQNEAATAPATQAPESTNSVGFVNCEFCKCSVKPYATYCKHCGIKLKG